jgi:hypothetical protein
MQERYRLYWRENGIYYLEDVATRKQESLKTKNRAEAVGLRTARNQASAHPTLNLALARTYLLGRSTLGCMIPTPLGLIKSAAVIARRYRLPRPRSAKIKEKASRRAGADLR